MRHTSARAGLLGLALLLAACGGAGGGPPPQGPPPAVAAPQDLSFVNWEIPPVHPLALDAGSQRLLLAHTADDRLEVYDVAAGAPLPVASIPVGLAPVSVRWRTAGEAWVVNHVSDSISVVDVAGRRVRATLATRDEPCDVVFASAPARAFVSCSQANVVQVFDPLDLAAPPVDVPIDGEDPRALAVSPDGQRVYVAIFESGNASTIVGGGIDEGGPLAAPGGFFPPNAVSEPSSPHLGLNPPPNAGAAFDPAPHPQNPPPPPVGLIVRKDPLGRWMDDNGGDWTALVSGLGAPMSGRPFGWDLPDRDLAILDASTLGTTYARGLMNLCMDVAVNPVTGQVAVVGTDALNEVRFEPVLNGRFLRVNLALVDPLAPANPFVADLNPHLAYDTPSVPPALRTQSLGDPRAVLFDAPGARLFVAGMGSNNVVQLTSVGARVALPPVDVGEGPCGLALHAAAGRLYVWNRFGASISVIDLATWSETSRTPIFDPTPDVIRAGRPPLYDTHATSGLGHVACASCHVDARMDRLAWDLGAPDATMTSIPEQNCGLGGLLPCPDFHPQKGPMTTQTLQDVIGHEPHHWRGDRRGLEDFNPAFASLLGADGPLPAAGMQAFEDFLATIAFPPNPFRNLDNTLPAALPLPGHFATGRFDPAGTPLPDGNALRGLLLYRTAGLDGSLPGVQLDCVTCHTLPTGLGTDHALVVDFLNPAASNYSAAPLPPGPRGERHLALVAVDGSTNVTIKVPQLRNLHEKVGFDCTQVLNNAGFGFLHDGSIDSLARFVSEPVFGPASEQDVADLVAFLLAFSGSDLPEGTVVGFSEPPGPRSLDTHAGVGRQVGHAGGAAPALLDDMRALAGSGAVDLIVRGSVGGQPRGWVLDRTTGAFVSDRDSDPALPPAALEALAAPGAEQTWTLVPAGLGVRLGIDRDEDGFGDVTEAEAGSDPTSQASIP